MTKSSFSIFTPTPKKNNRNKKTSIKKTGWWFQTCFIFTPKIGEDSHFDEHIWFILVQPPTRYTLHIRPQTYFPQILSPEGCPLKPTKPGYLRVALKTIRLSIQDLFQRTSSFFARIFWMRFFSSAAPTLPR